PRFWVSATSCTVIRPPQTARPAHAGRAVVSEGFDQLDERVSGPYRWVLFSCSSLCCHSPQHHLVADVRDVSGLENDQGDVDSVEHVESGDACLVSHLWYILRCMAIVSRVRVAWSGGAVPGGGLSTFYFDTPSPGFQADVKDFFAALSSYVPSGVTWSIPNTGEEINTATGDIGATWTDGVSAVVTGSNPTTTYAAG